MISQMENQNEDGHAQTPSDFSIDHILNRAGNSRNGSTEETRTSPSYPLDPYSWLQCTRYSPPKIPRAQKREGPQKRQLGRHPRIPFTSHQLSILEEKFQQSPYLSSEQVIILSKKLDLADIRVKIWFQNRRARERRERVAGTEPQPHNKVVNPQEERIKSPKKPTMKLEEDCRLSPSFSPTGSSTGVSQLASSPTQLSLSPTVFYGNPFFSSSFVTLPTFYANIATNNQSENR